MKENMPERLVAHCSVRQNNEIDSAYNRSSFESKGAWIRNACARQIERESANGGAVFYVKVNGASPVLYLSKVDAINHTVDRLQDRPGYRSWEEEDLINEAEAFITKLQVRDGY